MSLLGHGVGAKGTLTEHLSDMAATTRIHALLEQEQTLVFPGVYDALGAKLVERAGFPLTFISGYSVAASHLGLPDFGYLTQTEVIDVTRRVCASVGIPIIIDADTGYGNALNVIRTVNELIEAGAAGMFLEDQVWPKRCGHMKGKRVIPTDEHVQKIRAAVDARRDRDFFIVARTDARQVNGLDDAIRRCMRYREAGADALFVEGPRSVEELSIIGRRLPPPLVANMLEGGVTPLLTKEELGAIGFQLIVCPLTALYASAKAIQEIFAILKTAGTTRAAMDRLLPFQQFHDLIDLDGYYALDERYKAHDDDEGKPR
jgi:methylisocitrate lyase